jgi:endonuclease G
VLEHGAIAEDTENKISVFSGPIFDDAIDLWSDDVQIPSSYFKVIVWKSKDGKLKSVGLVVDQLALMSEQRKNLGQPRAPASVAVTQWRVGIASIEKRTGLSFGDKVRDADTISANGQPVVGEAVIPIKSMEDLLPRGGV